MSNILKRCAGGRGPELILAQLIVLIILFAPMAQAELTDEAKRNFNRGIELTDAGKADSAIAAYEAATMESPEYLQAHINVGALYYDKGNLEKAAEHLNKAVALDSANVSALKSLGLVHLKADKFKDAIAVFNRHNALIPDDAGVWASLATAYDKAGDKAAAKAANEKAVAADPTDYKSLYNIGNSYQEEKKYTQAIDAYSKAIKAKPDYIQAYWNRAISAQLADQLECVDEYESFIEAAKSSSKWKQQVAQARDIVKQIKDYLETTGG